MGTTIDEQRIDGDQDRTDGAGNRPRLQTGRSMAARRHGLQRLDPCRLPGGQNRGQQRTAQRGHARQQHAPAAQRGTADHGYMAPNSSGLA